MNLNEVAEEIKAILVEAEFGARWMLIEAHHQVGKLILSLKGDRTQLVQRLAVRTGRSERTLWYDIKFAEKYRNVNDLPEGKNVSWNKVIRKHLTDSTKEAQPCEHKPITICAKCKILLTNEPD